ncbi:hypothetical protein QJQ58_06475 [Paenibacillus dendritiformis]|nr:hypothetical protein [Paenibacillus dendritiformis]WGU95905.1 hypothetical protein QJQ58_06475 [Paenibacillus dendritiformis]
MLDLRDAALKLQAEELLTGELKEEEASMFDELSDFDFGDILT